MNLSSALTSNFKGAPPAGTENSLRKRAKKLGFSRRSFARVSEKTAPPHTSCPGSQTQDASSMGWSGTMLTFPRS